MKTVLVIDDQKIVTVVAGTFLKKMGFEVFEFNNSVEALEFYNKKQPDLILTDLSMPNLDGFDLIRRLKKINKSVEIIAMSAVFNSSRDIIKAARLGVSDFLLKPILFETLEKKIAYLNTKNEFGPEWRIDRNKYPCNGSALTKAEIISIGEFSLTVKTNLNFTPGIEMSIDFKLLKDIGINSTSFEVLSTYAFEQAFISKLKIKKLIETDAVKIRQLCRSLDYHQLKRGRTIEA